MSSGTVNAGDPFDLRANATAEESTYAGIVRLVRAAQAEKGAVRPPGHALLFVPLALAVAGAAWLISGDPVRAGRARGRDALSLDPGGAGRDRRRISRAARQGILVKGGETLETLARGKVLLDKTGTLTTGRARLHAIETDDSIAVDELLRLAASLDQASSST